MLSRIVPSVALLCACVTSGVPGDTAVPEETDETDETDDTDGANGPGCADLERFEVPQISGDRYFSFFVNDVLAHGNGIWLRATTTQVLDDEDELWLGRYDCEAGEFSGWSPAAPAGSDIFFVTWAVSGERLLLSRHEWSSLGRSDVLRVYDVDGDPIGPERPLTVDGGGGLAQSAGLWIPYKTGWVGLQDENPRFSLFQLDADGVSEGQLATAVPTPDTLAFDYALAGGANDPHVVWSETRDGEPGKVRALGVDGGAFDVVDMQPYDQLWGIPGSPWLDISRIDAETGDFAQELVHLDGRVRTVDGGYYAPIPGTGGLFLVREREVEWLADQATQGIPLASEPDHQVHGVSEFGDGRVAVLWSPPWDSEGSTFVKVYASR